MNSHFALVMLEQRMADAARFAERRRKVRSAGELRTGDSPERIAERRRRGEQTPGESAARAGWAGFLGGSG